MLKILSYHWISLLILASHWSIPITLSSLGAGHSSLGASQHLAPDHSDPHHGYNTHLYLHNTNPDDVSSVGARPGQAVGQPGQCPAVHQMSRTLRLDKLPLRLARAREGEQSQ